MSSAASRDGRAGETWEGKDKEGIMRAVRGKSVDCRRKIFTAGKTEIGGVKPLIVVYVKPGKRWEQEFYFICQKKGIVFTAIEGIAVLSFECVGAPEALEDLSGWRGLLEWHLRLDVKPPRNGYGQGKEKRVEPLFIERLKEWDEYVRDEVDRR